MKLRLKNFRCYEEKEFDFGEEGLVLLSGPSGTGKSSVMMAIMFALYGEGVKVTMHGKTNCQVELEMDNLIITRTKRPNRVVLYDKNTNEEFEDASAQGIINEKFGEQFSVTSYVQQNVIKSFILMNPTEKLEFLEKLVFQGTDLGKIKGRCQSQIKEREKELTETNAQLLMATEYFKTRTKPEKVTFPIKSQDKEKTTQREEKHVKNSKILIKRGEKKIEQLLQEIVNRKIYDSEKISKSKILSTLVDKIEKKQNEQETTFYIGDKELNRYETQLSVFLSHKQLLSLQERYETDKEKLRKMEETDREEKQKEIDQIKSSLWNEYKKEELEEQIESTRDLLQDVEEIERLEKEEFIDEKKIQAEKAQLEIDREKLEERRELLRKLELQEESYECPGCHLLLRFQENKLQPFETEHTHSEISIDELKNEISLLLKTIKKYEKLVPENENRLSRYKLSLLKIEEIKNRYEEELPPKEELSENLNYFEQYKRDQLDLEKRLEKLEKKGKNSLIETFKTQLQNQETTIRKLQAGFKQEFLEQIDEEKVREKINREKQNKTKKNAIQLEIQNLEKERTIVLQELSSLEETNRNVKNLTELEDELKTEKENIENLKKKQELHTRNLEQIEKYKKYKEEQKTYNEWKTKIENLSSEEEIKKNRLTAVCQLKEKILQAESIAIQNVINSINIYAQEYLELFFTDQIIVRLTPFKTTKKKTVKPQINIEINYRDIETDISVLSGGELARVVLAYTLALSEIFNSPMIMLDESTASLDQDATSLVMDGIKQHFSTKLTIVIAHQVVSGEFDRQIFVT